MKERPSTITLLVVGLYLLLMIIGCPENEPRVKPVWGPRPQMDRIGGGSSDPASKPTYKKPPKTFTEDPWMDDAKWNTMRWQDFIEDLDEEGIMLSDPDALDIWEESYD